jgi:uncharacterized SAM-binding protein YcdF (DUF218 family)
MRRLWAAVSVVLLLAVGIVLTRSWWLPVPGKWLDVSERLEPADIIFLPAGQSLWRAKAAATLYQQRYAPKVVATAGGESEMLLLVTGERIMDAEIVGRMLKSLGVPTHATTLISGVTSTREDAEALRKYIESHHVRSAIVVTSHLHSRRIQWMLRRVIDTGAVHLRMVEADQPHLRADRWWQSEDGLLTVVNEYLKYGYYLTHY